MKILTKTVTTTMEVAAVPIKGTDDFVYVYSRFPPEDEIDQVFCYVMKKEDFDNATSPNELKHYQFKMPHQKKGKYDSIYIALPLAAVDALKTGEMNWYDEKKHPMNLEFGQPLPDDVVVIGFSHADYKFCNLDGTYINRILRDSYMDRYYDIGQIIKDRTELKDIIVLKEREYHSDDRNPIYYVPGNGATVNLGIILTDEQYAEYAMLEYWDKSRYLNENTSLGKYKRPEPLDCEDDD